MAVADSNKSVTARLDAHRAEILGAIAKLEASIDRKVAALEGKVDKMARVASDNSIGIAKVNGQLDGFCKQIERNAEDIKEVRTVDIKEIRSWIVRMLLAGAASGAFAGAVAAAIVRISGS